MKNIILTFAGALLFTSSVHGQSFRLGSVMGFTTSFSYYYDKDVDPIKNFSTTEPTAGLELDYFPFKSQNIFFSTGLSFVRFANAFRVEGVPVFGHNEGFQKVKQHYYGFKMPLRIGHRFNTKGQLEINTSFGCGFTFFVGESLFKFQEGELNRTIRGKDYTLYYDFVHRNTGSEIALFFDTNIEVGYKITKKNSIGISFAYQLGVTPVNGSILSYKITNNTDQYTLIGDSYISSKGDAIFLTLSLRHILGKAKK